MQSRFVTEYRISSKLKLTHSRKTFSPSRCSVSSHLRHLHLETSSEDGLFDLYKVFPSSKPSEKLEMLNEAWRKWQNTDLAMSLYDSWRQSDPTGDHGMFAAITEIYRQSSKQEEILRVWQDMRDLGIRPKSAIHFGAILNAVVGSQDKSLLDDLVARIKDGWGPINAADCSQLLKVLHPKEVIDIMKQTKTFPDSGLLAKFSQLCRDPSHAYLPKALEEILGHRRLEPLINMYSKCRSYDDVHRLSLYLPKDSHIQSDFTRASVLRSALVLSMRWVEQDQLHEVIHIIKELLEGPIKPDGHMWNYAINVFAQRSAEKAYWRRACYLFRAMRASGTPGDVYTYSTLLRGSLRARKFEEEGLDIIQCMIQDGLLFDQVLITTIAMGCAQVQDLSVAKKFLQNMPPFVLSADESGVLGGSAIAMLGRCGDMTLAFQVFKALDQIRTQPKVVAALTTALGNMGLTEEALQAYHSIDHPTSEMCKSAFIACAYRGWVDQATHILDNFILKGHAMDAPAWIAYLSVLCQADRLHQAQECLRWIPRKTKQVWQTLLMGYWASQDKSSALLFAKSFLKNQGLLDSLCLSLLYDIFVRAGDLQAAQLVQSRMARGKLSVPQVRHILQVNEVALPFVEEDGLRVPSNSQIRDRLHQVLRSEDRQIQTSTACGCRDDMAIGYLLLTTPEKSRIKLSKNLLICGPCQDHMAHLSRKTSREIHVRDLTGKWHIFDPQHT
eukprot:TRINITY_DN4608_c0_g1_i2.p1 TRINITY_DN4608_c0_g1~~TRINITY_DN4608_c0_g1_i2.p1  ORF type:complete len:727 (-),score=147.25 TRINITY_DN4608_c0_g1_i2:58-2238(-)